MLISCSEGRAGSTSILPISRRAFFRFIGFASRDRVARDMKFYERQHINQSEYGLSAFDFASAWNVFGTWLWGKRSSFPCHQVDNSIKLCIAIFIQYRCSGCLVSLRKESTDKIDLERDTWCTA